jgi:hypothetical protein
MGNSHLTGPSLCKEALGKSSQKEKQKKAVILFHQGFNA